jgi:hypothetical protein
MYNWYYLLCLGVIVEPHIPQNGVDQMNEVLVNQLNLHGNSSLDGIPGIMGRNRRFFGYMMSKVHTETTLLQFM